MPRVRQNPLPGGRRTGDRTDFAFARRATASGPFGFKEPFREVARDLQELAGIRLSRKDAERVSERIGAEMEQWQERERMALRFTEPPPPEAPKTIETLYVEFDGTGVPMVPNELAGRKGKQPDGSAKTREAKLGCVFTQTAFDNEGRPIRDSGTTSFVGAIENAQTFGNGSLPRPCVAAFTKPNGWSCWATVPNG